MSSNLYPSGIDQFTSGMNFTSQYSSSYINDLQVAVVSTEQYLGTNVSPNLFGGTRFITDSISNITYTGSSIYGVTLSHVVLGSPSVTCQFSGTYSGPWTPTAKAESLVSLNDSVSNPVFFVQENSPNLTLISGNQARIIATPGFNQITSSDGKNVYGDAAAGRQIFKYDSSITPYSTSIVFNISGVTGFAGDGGPAIFASATTVIGTMASSSGGSIYFSDSRRIRQINSSGIVNSILNTANVNGTSVDGAVATGCAVSGVPFPIGYRNNNFYYYESGFRIRRIDSSGLVWTVAGTGLTGGTGDGGDARLAKISLNTATPPTIDDAGNIYFISSFGNNMRMINTSGIINTVAGASGLSASITTATPITGSIFNSPNCILGMGTGIVYYMNSTASAISKLNYLDINAGFAYPVSVGYYPDIFYSNVTPTVLPIGFYSVSGIAALDNVLDPNSLANSSAASNRSAYTNRVVASFNGLSGVSIYFRPTFNAYTGSTFNVNTTYLTR